MSEQRAEILRRVQQALGRQKAPSVDIAAADLETRLTDNLPRPEWNTDSLSRFCERLEAAAGSHARVSSINEVPRAVGDYLENLETDGHKTGLSPHPRLTELDWPEDLGIDREFANARTWGTAIAVGYMGIAETGSVVMPSGPTRPTTLNFLPDRHIVVLAIEDIVDYMESVWDRLLAEGEMPRTVNVITGPSRTADVEQTLQLGAHGPRSLHVILVG
mgnify:FL=1